MNIFINAYKSKSFTLLIISCLSILFAGNIYSQTAFSIKNSSDSSYIYIDNNGNVAIDTSSILSSLTIGGENGIISTGTVNSGNSLSISGAGARMMWYPKKAAFRVGYISSFNSDYWDDSNIGYYSLASGEDTKASGNNSIAFGNSAIASADNSISFGTLTMASGSGSIALGTMTTASGGGSIGLGKNLTSSGNTSTAMGGFSKASGDYSTATGYSTTASGNYSTAIGDNTTASGDFSTAMGFKVNTGGHQGSFAIGDYSTTLNAYCLANNQMMMRFDGGYVFYTSGDTSTAAYLNNGSNSWSTTSDSTKKYAFLPVNGQNVLNKLSKFNLRTWSYKGQDSTKFRHYGPMAQEFFAAFGHDKYGVIGNDTTINQADFEGINLVAIQALDKEVKSLSEKLIAMKKENEILKNKLNKQQNLIAKQENEINKLKKNEKRFVKFENAVVDFMSKHKDIRTQIATKFK